MVKPLVSYDIDQDGRFKAFLNKVVKENDDLSFSMGEAARIIKKESTANFILKGYGKYPPLDPVYKKRKDRLAPGTPILTGVRSYGGQSGALKDSILGNTAGSIILVGKLSLVVGTKVKTKKNFPYPVAVQEGTRKMPARKFLFFTDKMVSRIINTIDDEIARIWKHGKN